MRNKVLKRLQLVLRRAGLKLKYAGTARYCPLCRSHVRCFLPHGVIPRPNAVCPVCQSRDRHRLAWLFLVRETAVLTGRLDFLHLAPEPEVACRLRRLPNLRYVSGDLVNPAMQRMDICQLPLPDGSVDMIYCSHVLNMLPDDRPAMENLFRVLRPGGFVLIQVPVSRQAATTIEAGAHSSPAERLELFGDSGMYRRYGGEDLSRRLAAVGFGVEAVPYCQRFPEAERIRLGLSSEDLYVCRRRERP